jgi:pyruvate/2-oxoglutarate dehydrogenase complex dihydrolipoamide acyltransferase (E2) component
VSDEPIAGRHMALVAPDLGLGDTPIILTVWHVKRGQAVTQGDRLVELVAGSVAIDLPSPATGLVRRLLAREDERIAIGQSLAELSLEHPG